MAAYLLNSIVATVALCPNGFPMLSKSPHPAQQLTMPMVSSIYRWSFSNGEILPLERSTICCVNVYNYKKIIDFFAMKNVLISGV